MRRAICVIKHLEKPDMFIPFDIAQENVRRACPARSRRACRERFNLMAIKRGFVNNHFGLITNFRVTGFEAGAWEPAIWEAAVYTRLVLLFMLISGSFPVARADWSAIAQGTGFYTDDVGIFSATRRLTRDGDPTQPA